MKKAFDEKWASESEEIQSGMKEWRLQHPKATLNEIEAALDERLGRMRARMLEDMSMARDAEKEEEGVECPECGHKAKPRGGKQERRLLTRGKQEIVLKRRRWECPACGAGFFPPG